jgi:tetratricopeptide (TPR) repeat protein
MNEEAAEKKAENLKREGSKLRESSELANLREASLKYDLAAAEYSGIRNKEREARECRGHSKFLSGIVLLEMSDVKGAAEAFESAEKMFSAVGDEIYQKMSQTYWHLALAMQQILDFNFEGARVHYNEAVRQLKILTERAPEAAGKVNVLTLEVGGEVNFTQAFLLYVKGDLEGAMPLISESVNCYRRVSELKAETNFGRCCRGYLTAIQSAPKIWIAKKLQKEWDLESAQKSLKYAEDDLSKALEAFSEISSLTPKEKALQLRVQGERSIAVGLLEFCRALKSLVAGKPEKARRKLEKAKESYGKSVEELSKAGYFGHFELILAKDEYEDCCKIIQAIDRYRKRGAASKH